jgi:Flp pilus assembly protein TadD
LALLVQNKPDQAISQFRIVLKFIPDHPDTLYYLGRAYLAKKQPAAAASCLERAVDLRPDDSHAHNVLGVALAETGNFSRAGAELRTARRLEPGNAIFSENLACVEQRLHGCDLTP